MIYILKSWVIAESLLEKINETVLEAIKIYQVPSEQEIRKKLSEKGVYWWKM